MDIEQRLWVEGLLQGAVFLLSLVPLVAVVRRFQPTTWQRLQARIEEELAHLPPAALEGRPLAAIRQDYRRRVANRLWVNSFSVLIPTALGWVGLALLYDWMPGLPLLMLAAVGVLWLLAVGSLKLLIHPGYFLAEEEFYLSIAARRMGLPRARVLGAAAFD